MGYYQVTFRNSDLRLHHIYVEAAGICPAIEQACNAIYNELGLSGLDYEPVKAIKVAPLKRKEK